MAAPRISASNVEAINGRTTYGGYAVDSFEFIASEVAELIGVDAGLVKVTACVYMISETLHAYLAADVWFTHDGKEYWADLVRGDWGSMN